MSTPFDRSNKLLLGHATKLARSLLGGSFLLSCWRLSCGGLFRSRLPRRGFPSGGFPRGRFLGSGFLLRRPFGGLLRRRLFNPCHYCSPHIERAPAKIFDRRNQKQLANLRVLGQAPMQSSIRNRSQTYGYSQSPRIIDACSCACHLTQTCGFHRKSDSR